MNPTILNGRGRALFVLMSFAVLVSGTPRTPFASGSASPSSGADSTLRLPVREKILLDRGWRFRLGNAASATADFGYGAGENFAKAADGTGPQIPGFDDRSWRIVDLPHDWAVGLEYVYSLNESIKDHGFKPVGRMFPETSIGWYRKNLPLLESDRGRKLWLQFDGVFRDCQVWLNGHYLGRHESGYGEFGFDIADLARFGEDNLLVARVDATQFEGWFYEGAGIYRHVWLIKTEPVHFARHGIYVSTGLLSAGRSAWVDVESVVDNEGESPVEAELQMLLRDPEGRTVWEGRSRSIHVGGGKTLMERQRIRVKAPRLWSLAAPNLYTLVSWLRRAEGVADSMETVFGIRTIRFDSERGFLLNGEPVKILGVCCHQDHAGVGSALPDRLQSFRIERLKAMGCNAYRTSHNPPTPELLDACDRLGMLVLDENRLMGTSGEMMHEFEQLILRDRNHPSVILWSIGNEEFKIQNTDIGKRLAIAMIRRQRELDPSRLCTYAANNGTHFEGINSVIDVRGINYWRLGDFDQYHRDHPDQPLLGTEEGSTLCTRGVYAIDSSRGYMSDYDISAPRWGLTAEQWWGAYADRPWLAGAFVWTGFDYRGEPTPYAWPCVNSHFGIMDVCGFPKNNFYYYQAWWSSGDVLHLAPHWNWPGRVGQPISVWCQSNCDSVELFLNGISQGRKVMPRNSHLQWTVLYAPGTLRATGWRGGRKMETRVETTGSPTRLRLVADRDTIQADGADCAVVSVSAEDEAGRAVPVAGNLILLTVQGAGWILGVGNGDPSSHEPDQCPEGAWRRSLFNGRCQVILQGDKRSGSLTLKAASEGLAPAALTIDIK